MKLNKELIKELCKYISNGLSQKDSCCLCDIDESTFYIWKKKAEGQTKGLYFEFIQSLKKATARHKAWHISNIRKASEKNWTASAWILERKYFKEFGRKQALEHMGKDGEDINIKVTIGGKELGKDK